MRWVRDKLRLGSTLALCALALQLWLAFGHIHAEDFAPTQPQIAAADGSGPAPGLPDDHDDCPICSVMHLAGTLVLPAPPAIVAVDPPVVAPSVPALATITSVDCPQAFQARGPPAT